MYRRPFRGLARRLHAVVMDLDAELLEVRSAVLDGALSRELAPAEVHPS